MHRCSGEWPGGTWRSCAWRYLDDWPDRLQLGLPGSFVSSSAGRLILTVPYEDGWTVLVNGQEMEGTLFGGALMAFDLEP